MMFERSFDYPLLNSLLQGSSSLYQFLGDDFAPPLEDATVVEHPAVWYILAYDDGKLLGFWMFEQRSAILFDFHTLMPLNSRALVAMRELLGPDGWLWTNTPCLRATTAVPSSNAIALRFGLRAGLEQFGTNPKSYFKNGTLCDQHLLGASKPKDQ